MVYFCQTIDVFFGLYNVFPPRPETPFTYVVYVYRDILLSNGHLGYRGEASKNKLKDTSFTFSMTNVTLLSIFRTHAHDEYRKVLEMKTNSILIILALLPSKTSNAFAQIRKMRVGSRWRKFSWICKFMINRVGMYFVSYYD